MSGLELVAFDTLPEVRPDDDLARLILDAASRESFQWSPDTALVIAQKVVSKCEGRTVPLADVEPSARAAKFAADWGKDARLIELALRESRRVVRMERGVLITETQHGWICANSGVDRSNSGGVDQAVLLPLDPDRSALHIREAIEQATGVSCAVVISDTFGRPWRRGLVNVAIGVSGLAALRSDPLDRDGQTMLVSVAALADELAAAAGLVAAKASGRPVIAIRGLSFETGEGSYTLQRSADEDLFR